MGSDLRRGGRMLPSLLLLALAFSAVSAFGGYEGASANKGGHINDNGDVSAEGDAVNHPGMDATSKACRYDDGPGWSDCDPFELIRFRVLRLIHGGSQCEEMKNITKHCTPHDFPFGTHWLIQEHRKCIAELNRLKAMISDLHKFIETLHAKGKELFSAYLKLKEKLDKLKVTLDKLKVDGEHQQEILQKLKDEIEEWKTKARDLQTQLDELKAKFHDLQSEEHDLTLKNTQLTNDVNVLSKENEGIEMKIEKIARENEELRRRITESEHTKEKVELLRADKNKVESKLDRMKEYLEKLKDDPAEQRIKNLKSKIPEADKAIDLKDTHVDLSMEMFITHNKTNLYKPTYAPIYYSTEKPYYAEHYDQGKCLISYYGATNETCWYETEGERSEDAYVDALGHHLVEAHWKYFTIDVKDQAECDKASHLHYEFLINRCSPKHYLPVMAVFRPSNKEESLGTHFYPKIQTAGKQNTCWITFLGAHGHCEAHNDKFDLYNTDDTPVIATYVPEGVSSNWQTDWIMHDSHGGRMFEESEDALNHINPDSLNPHAPVNPSEYKSEFKSMAPKSPDYHDSPEYRKSLHLQGEEKEAMLASLRARLGMSGAAAGVSKDVKQHQGVDTGAAGGGAMAGAAGGESSMASMAKAEDGYAYAASASSSYSYSSSSSATYEETTTTPYEAPTTTYEAPTTTYEAPTTAYEAPTEAPYDEPPSYTEPRDGDSGAEASASMGGHAAGGSDMEHELEPSHNPSLINFKK